MWRAMTEDDLPRVNAIAAVVHPGYPEDAAIFEERLALYPAGCQVLVATRDVLVATGGALAGYIVSHPWRDREPPPLNSLLGALPAQPSTYYIHDIALLPEARGAGVARTIAAALIDHARQAALPAVSLVAVNRSQAFWRRMGFQRVDDERLAAKLASYDGEACLMELWL
jgi:ribosomal protein S18 acetylase RimI-like enzyme